MDLKYWWRFFSAPIKALGPSAGLQWASYRLRSGYNLPFPARLELTPRGVRHPVVIQTRPHSDELSFEQIFVDQEYACLGDINPTTIIDCGANVGYASVYFAHRFPNARIIAVEPSPRNFMLLKRNCALYPAIIPVPGAVWSECRKLALVTGSFRDGKEWSSQVEPGDGSISGFDIPYLARSLCTDSVDLLKIDIERAELELFSGNCDAWLPMVRNICIELHDEECEKVFFSALSGYQYDLSRFGELTICRNLSRR